MYLRILSQDFCLGFDPKTPDANGHDAFWYADQSQNSAGVRAALLAPIEIVRAEDSKNKDEKAKPETTKKEVRQIPQLTPGKSSCCAVM